MAVLWRVIKRPWPNDTEKKLNLKTRRDEQNEQVTEGNPGILGSRAKTRCSAGASAWIATKLNRVLSTASPQPFRGTAILFHHRTASFTPADLRTPSSTLDTESPAGERLKQMSGQRRP